MRRMFQLLVLFPIGLIVLGCRTVTGDVYSADASVSLESSKFRVKTESTGTHDASGTAEREYLFWFIPVSGPNAFAATGSDGWSFKDPLRQAALYDACEKADADILLDPVYEETTDRGLFAFRRKRSVSVKGTPAKVTGAEEIPVEQWGEIFGDASGTRIGGERDPVVSSIGLSEPESKNANRAFRGKLSFNGGAHDGDSRLAHIEWCAPIGNSQFDFSARGLYSTVENEFLTRLSYTYVSYYYVWSGWRWRMRSHRYRNYYYVDMRETQDNFLGECSFLWNPLRGKMFAPFAGVGVRFERSELKNYYRGETETDDGLSAVGRIGIDVNLGKWDLRCEGLFGNESKELIGSVGYDVSSGMQLSVFADRLDVDLDKSVMYGAGLSFYL